MKIKHACVTADPNNKWELCVFVDEDPSIPMSEIAHIKDSRFHYGEDEHGFARIGISNDKPSMGHAPGYMWSSRASVFNAMFHVDIIEITLCTPHSYDDGYTRWGSYYMDVYKALKLLPEDFRMYEMEDDDGEYGFFIFSDGEKPEHWGWNLVCEVLRR